MREFRTDLHIHTALSPCGDLEMSPSRIVSLARNRGLDIIGITDHNSTKHQLGFIPPELKIDALQISKGVSEKVVRDKFRINSQTTLVKFSDSHYPDDLGKTYTLFNMEKPTFDEIRKALTGLDGRKVRIP